MALPRECLTRFEADCGGREVFEVIGPVDAAAAATLEMPRLVLFTLSTRSEVCSAFVISAAASGKGEGGTRVEHELHSIGVPSKRTC